MMLSLFRKIYKRIRNRPLFNIYGTNFPKKVLVSYITYPFREGASRRHSNYQESLVIAETFNEIGYKIDVFHQDYQKKIDYSKYDLVFGVGEPLEKSFYYSGNKRIIKIYYGLGRQIIVNNKASLKRVRDFYQKNKQLMLDSARIGEKAWQIQTTLSNAIITLGNEVTINSYKEFYDGKIYNLPVTFIKTMSYKDVVSKKNFSKAREHFLWMGGSGLLHKGLDLLIEFFSKQENADLHLHVCGPTFKETEFMNFYAEKIRRNKNIYVYGFIDVNSKKFEEILLKTAFIISPTCSEGQPSSVITGMGNGGLIPILTKESSINIGKEGILIDDLNLKSVAKAVKESQNITEFKLREMSLLSGEKTNRIHNINNFKKQLKKHLVEILGENDEK